MDATGGLSTIIGGIGSALNGIFGFLGKKQDVLLAGENSDAAYLASLEAAKTKKMEFTIGAIVIVLVVTLIVVAFIIKRKK